MRNSTVKIIPIIFYGLLFLFLVSYLVSLDYSRLREADFVFKYFVFASILALTHRYFGAFIWLFMLSSLGAKNVFQQKSALVEVYAKSWLGRYIPGKAAWILGKIYFASKLGVSKNKLAVSSLLEASLQVGTMFLLAFMILVFETRIDFINNEIRVMLGLFIALGIVALVPKVFNTLLKFFYKLYKKKDFDSSHQVDGKTVLKSAALYTVASALSALSFFFIAMTVYADLTVHDLAFVASISILASALSMLAFFAPSGIGVKEGVQIAMLSIIMPTEIALVIAVATRIWSTLIDLIFFSSTKVWHKKSQKYRRP